MQYQIVLPPDIRVSPEAFADAWNADEQSSVVAEARLKPAQTRSYDPLTVSTVVVDHQIGLGAQRCTIWSSMCSARRSISPPPRSGSRCERSISPAAIHCWSCISRSNAPGAADRFLSTSRKLERHIEEHLISTGD